MRLQIEEENLFARDAYSSATTFCVLVSVVGVIQQLTTASTLLTIGPLGLAITLYRACFIVVAGVLLIALLVTRSRPRMWLARTTFLVLLAPMFPLMAILASAWAQLDRPVEAFVIPHLASVSVALVLVGSFRMGILMLGLVQLETLGIWLFLRASGPVPLLEPALTAMFGTIGLGLLWIRHQRRAFTRRYLRASAEADTIRALGTRLDAVGRQLSSSLDAIARHVDKLTSGISGPQVRGAIDRLGRLRDHLLPHLDAAASMRPVNEMRPKSDDQRRLMTDAERDFFARDTYAAAVLAAIMLPAMYFMVFVGSRPGEFGWERQWLWPLSIVYGLLWLLVLVRRRHRPSNRLALVAFVCLFVPAAIGVSADISFYMEQSRPFDAFTGAKLGMCLIPMLLPRHLWVGVAFSVILAVVCIVTYYQFEIWVMADRISLAEPYMTMVYFWIGLMLLFLRDQRRVVSLSLLRKHAEVATLSRQAGISMAILDQIGSPLQVLSLGIELLERRPGSELELASMKAEVAKLASLARIIRVGDAGPAFGQLSFDSAYELERRDALSA